MKKFLIPICSFIFLLSSTGSARAFEHPRYDIEATIDTTNKKLNVQQQVTFTNNTQTDVESLYFYIYPNRQYKRKEIDFILRYSAYFKVDFFPEGFQTSKMRINQLTLNGQPADFEIEGKDKSLLQVPLNRPLSPGASVEVSMKFTLEIPHAYGRLGWHDNMIRLSRWYPLLVVHNDEGWQKNPFYPFHRPFYNEAGYYSVRLNVPNNQVVIHSGERINESDQPNNLRQLEIDSSLPIREFTLAMSPDYQRIEEDFQGITIKSYYLPGEQSRGQEALDVTKDLMKYFTQWFGQYPYKQFSIAPVHLGYGGEQMSNLIFIDTRFYQLPQFLKRYFEFLIAHEAGHQWLFNLVGIDEFNEMWVEEGINSYFIHEYLVDKYGENPEVIEWPHWFEDYSWILPELTFDRTQVFRYKMMARIGMDHPVVDKLSSFKEPSSIFSLTYGKGSRIVGVLRTVLGDETFKRVFKRVFTDFAHQNLGVDDFIRLCEEESGQDLDWFFEPWLFTDKKLDYAVNDVKGQTIYLQNKGEINIPVRLRVDYKDGRSEDITNVSWAGEQHQIRVNASGPIEQVRIDPEDELLDVDRTNNSWPRIVDIKPVPIYLGLYDVPLFMNEDAYNFVIGPEISSGIGVKAAVHKPYDQSFYAGTNFEFGDELHRSRVGYQLKNILGTQTILGFEVSNVNDLDDDNDDFTSGKVFLRRELWPVQYGLGEINDHVSLYLIRNMNLNDRFEAITPREDVRNVDYSRRNESIVGTALTLNRSGPYPDPYEGYKISTFIESAGHFFNATQFFYRSGLDVSVYQSVTKKSKLAARVKYGWGYPNDKELFFLGGIDGLRGYDRKDIRGTKGLLGSLEYRFPIKNDLNYTAWDNLFGLEGVDGVFFFDLGQAWFKDFDDGSLSKDAGFGLRFKVNIGSFLEKIIVRADVAQAINDSREDTQFWFGINHAF